MKELRVQTILNSDVALSSEDGEEIFRWINSELKICDNTLHIDFEGIAVMSTAFLNAAFGQLHECYECSQLDDRLVFKNVSDENVLRIKMVKDRAQEYFKDKNKVENSAKDAFPHEC